MISLKKRGSVKKDPSLNFDDQRIITDKVNGTYNVQLNGYIVVRVDSSLGATTVNPNVNAKKGDHLLVTDVGNNAGTNIITITGLDTIETDKGSMLYRYDGSDWELIFSNREIIFRDASTNEVLAREADTLIANKFKTPAGGQGLEVRNAIDDVVARITNKGEIEARSGKFGLIGMTTIKSFNLDHFTNIGSNIDQGESDFGNKTFAGADKTTPGMTVTGLNGIYYFGGDASDFFDDSPSNHSAGSNPEFYIDMGSVTPVSAINVVAHDSLSYNAESIEIWGTNTEGSGYILLATIDNSPLYVDGELDKIYPFDVAGNFRYYRIKMTASGYSGAKQLELIDIEYHSTNNSTNTNISVGAGSYDSSTLKIYDENSIPISGVGKVNVAYSADGDPYSSLVDQESFKQLGNLAYSSQLDLEIQPVGDQRISYIEISTPSGQTMRVLSDGTVLSPAGKFGVPGNETIKTVIDGDFTNIGTNVDDSTSGEYRNNILTSDIIIDGRTWVEGTNFWTLTSATTGSWLDLANGTDNGNQGASFSLYELFVIDLGSASIFSSVNFTGSGNASVRLEGSNDWNGSGGTWTQITSQGNFSSGIVRTDDSAYRYIKLVHVSSSLGINLSSISVNIESGYHFTNNLFDVAMINGAGGSFSAGSLKAYDENDGPINGASKINVRYSVDGGAFQGDSVQTPASFPASVSTGTSSTIARPLSGLGLSGQVTIDKIWVDLSTGTDTVEYFYGVPNGPNWDITSLGSESKAFTEGVPAEFSFPPITLDADTAIFGYSIQGSNVNNRYNNVVADAYHFASPISGDLINTSDLAYLGSYTFVMGVSVVEPYDMEAFKTLGDIAYTTQFDLQLQLVGGQALSRITLSTPNTLIEATSDGVIKILDGGISVAEFSKGNIKMLNMPTSDPNEVGSLWNDSGIVKISAG
jgi:hypothetical protein